MPTVKETRVFQQGSTTYFYSSIFFPKDVQDDVFTLYSFVRTADDLVDCVPQKAKEFRAFKNEFIKAFATGKSKNDIILKFIKLCEKKKIKKDWVLSFLESMEADLHKKTYLTIAELEKYIYGSAEVIGLMMAQILGLSAKSHRAASMQGKAMQLVNFIRDINEDNELKRQYIPLNEIKKYGFTRLNKTDALANPDKFRALVTNQLDRYFLWQKQAEKGYQYIPKRYLVPIKTAAEMYNYTAHQILEDPFIIFEKKVKPSKQRIIFTIIKNFLLS